MEIINPNSMSKRHYYVFRPSLVPKLFLFMKWNLNSLAKKNFEPVPLLQAHKGIYDYNVITMK